MKKGIVLFFIFWFVIGFMTRDFIIRKKKINVYEKDIYQLELEIERELHHSYLLEDQEDGIIPVYKAWLEMENTDTLIVTKEKGLWNYKTVVTVK